MSKHDGTPGQRASMQALYLDYPELPELAELAKGWPGQGTSLVLGEGSFTPKIIFVGEAPGRVENRFGHPFIGPSGQRLDKALAQIRVSRAQVWITNAVKFWPRDANGKTMAPDFDELAVSTAYLYRELDILGRRGPYARADHMPSASPLVVPLGKVATGCLLGGLLDAVDGKMASMTGRTFNVTFGSALRWTVIPQYHPSALRSNPIREEWARVWDVIDQEVNNRKVRGCYRGYRKPAE